jgi:hypothetical protein
MVLLLYFVTFLIGKIAVFSAGWFCATPQLNAIDPDGLKNRLMIIKYKNTLYSHVPFPPRCLFIVSRIKQISLRSPSFCRNFGIHVVMRWVT